MKDLFAYINEGRRPGSKNKPKPGEEGGLPTPDGNVFVGDDGKNILVSDDVFVNGGKKSKTDPDKAVGKGENANGSKGAYAIDAPTDDDIKSFDDVDWETASIQKQMLRSCFDTETDFFIQGRAGWGKTSIIKDVAKKCGYHVITVYLDKAEATDLAGIPIAVKAEDRANGVDEARALPVWVKIMLDAPEKKWLLFFDEMNQAAPDVQSALMPIVLEHVICGIKFDNFFVGAAGNLMDENAGALSELGGPIEARFEIFEWATGTDEDWEDALAHLAKQHKLKLGDELFEAMAEVAPYFGSPRNVERYLLNWVENIAKLDDKKKKMYNPKLLLFQLNTTFKKAENDRARINVALGDKYNDAEKRQDKFELLAEKMYAFINHKEGAEEQTSGRRKRSATAGTMTPDMVNILAEMLENGYIDEPDGNGSAKAGGVMYGVSMENWNKIIGTDDADEPFTAEEVEWFNNTMFPKTGKKAKFQTDADFLKDKRLTDPKVLGIKPNGMYNI